jgi:hypothetical protein
MIVVRRKITGFRVYCDESNTDGNKPHPVYGAILVAKEDIREVQRELAEWRRREQMHGELKWEKVRGGFRLRKYKSLVDLLFLLIKRRRLLQFKAIILDKRAPEYRTFSKGDDELGFYKFYYHWLLRYFAPFPLDHGCGLEVLIDERSVKGDPYTKLFHTLNNGIRKELKAKRDVVTLVKPLNSEQFDLLQAADVLMGAIGFHSQGFHLRSNADKTKVELAHYIAIKAGLRDLTFPMHPLREDFKIVRWYWPGQPRQLYRRHAVDNPRPRRRRIVSFR